MVDEADRLIVNTDDEARQLITIHHADPARIDVVHPGVDLDVFRPGDRQAARATLGLPPDEPIVAFVGRIQPLKAPDIVLRAAAKLPGCGSSWPADRRAAAWLPRTDWPAWPTSSASPRG